MSKTGELVDASDTDDPDFNGDEWMDAMAMGLICDYYTIQVASFDSVECCSMDLS